MPPRLDVKCNLLILCDMKPITVSIFMLMIVAVRAVPASAQVEYKFGKVTRAELERTEYPDVAQGADAVVLEEVIEPYIVGYKSADKPQEYFTSVMRKIKILDERGLGRAKLRIPYTTKGFSYMPVWDVAGYVYSIENGEPTKRELCGDEVRIVRSDKRDGVVEISFSGVKAGDIIEYGYKYASISSEKIPDFYFGGGMPVLRSRYRVFVNSLSSIDCHTFVLGAGSSDIKMQMYRDLPREVRMYSSPQATLGSVSGILYGAGAADSHMTRQKGVLYSFELDNVQAVEGVGSECGVSVVFVDR